VLETLLRELQDLRALVEDFRRRCSL
jgi:hypothetical protein